MSYADIHNYITKEPMSSFLFDFGGRSGVDEPRAVAMKPFFRPFGACSRSATYPRLAPWALFFRRFAAMRRRLCSPAGIRLILNPRFDNPTSTAPARGLRPGGRAWRRLSADAGSAIHRGSRARWSETRRRA